MAGPIVQRVLRELLRRRVHLVPVVSEGLEAVGASVLIEPAPPEHLARGVDAGRNRELRHDADPMVGVSRLLLDGALRGEKLVLRVVREPDLAVDVAALFLQRLELVEVVLPGEAAVLVVGEDPELEADVSTPG